MAFDPATGQMVLFGGYDESGYLGDTWTYDGGNWTRQTPKVSPPARYGASMAFDSATGKMVLFGGTGYGGMDGETWTWDGTEWAEQSPATAPSARVNASMQFDSATEKMVLFGGQDAGGPSNETWTYDGTTWTRQMTVTTPPALKAASMAFDPTIGSMVLFGGDHGGDGGSLRNETWTYDGTNWTAQHPAPKPSARTRASMAFDQSSGEIVLFGGDEPVSSNATWTYDGTIWTEQSPETRPSPRAGAAMAFDPEDGRMVLFGGLEYNGYPGQTWTYQTPEASPNPPGHPRAHLEPLPNGRSYWIGEKVPTHFFCEDVEGGPGIESCTDSNGATAPTGVLDTSTFGEHTYAVTAVSKSGSVGIVESTYTVVKAQPYVSAHASDPISLGGQISATAELEFGYQPGGTITFHAYGPGEAACSGPPAYTSAAVPVSGDGSYVSSPVFTPLLPGTYYFTAEYSGDGYNEPRSSECWWRDASVAVGPPTVTPEPEPTPGLTAPGGSITPTPTSKGASPSTESPGSQGSQAGSPSPAVVVSYGVSHVPTPSGENAALYTFHFADGRQGSKFVCRLDEAAFAPCHSPTSYRHLGRGQHRFAVESVGATGSRSAARVIRFFVGPHRR